MRTVVVVVVAAVSTLAGAVLRAPVAWRPEDRLGFVRHRKTGSTTLHVYMERQLGLCINQCDKGAQFKCLSCVYGTECVGELGECPADNSTQACYPCAHLTLPALNTQYRLSLDQRLAAAETP